ncbi:hypothetical protein B296_00028528 [Ensete ventricosum]|uniref:Uncharacterized protein n=1 Tax=Ensete ventricosum TaxID=4639 RepID=A0A426ZL07_ENSVE|nr:hypothetical protein B296_00028528 [Ensete ventricosum]
MGQAYGGAPTTFLISLKALRLPVSVTTRKQKKERDQSSATKILNSSIWNLDINDRKNLGNSLASSCLDRSRRLDPSPLAHKSRENNEGPIFALVDLHADLPNPTTEARSTKIKDQEPDKNLETSPPSIRSVRLSEIPALSSPWVPIRKRGHRSSCAPHGSGRSMQF